MVFGYATSNVFSFRLITLYTVADQQPTQPHSMDLDHSHFEHISLVFTIRLPIIFQPKFERSAKSERDDRTEPSARKGKLDNFLI